MSNPKLAKNLIWRETDDGIVVVDPKEGKVRVFNGVGSEIWKLISADEPKAAIEKRIAESYDIPVAQAESDIAAFLAQLAEREMIAWQ